LNEAYWTTPIEPGPLMWGDDSSESDYDKPARRWEIRRRYTIARFPVTNRQYLQFLESLSSEEAERRRPRSWPGRRYRSGEGSHPVVNVSWGDIDAFVEWAQGLMRNAQVLRPDETVRLPIEPEWERAAAYPVYVSPDNVEASKRRYPWGEWHADPTLSMDSQAHSTFPGNIQETGIGGTSVVGIFPHGAADCGAQDMVGNVREHCANWLWHLSRYQSSSDELGIEIPGLPEDGQEFHTVRGGSMFVDINRARSTSRGHDDYGGALPDVGFRLLKVFPLERSSGEDN
jgi:formylglycine-generating enzyme required for sulfatase activity